MIVVSDTTPLNYLILIEAADVLPANKSNEDAKMPERHTVDFDRVGFNILSDAERGVVTLQFDRSDGLAKNLKSIKHLLKIIDRRFGVGVWCRVNRWRRGEHNPLRLTSRNVLHPENLDVICCEMAVPPGEPLDPALADLIDFFRRQPGYRRTLGAPLDCDEWKTQLPKATGDVSECAISVLKHVLKRRRSKQPGATDAE